MSPSDFLEVVGVTFSLSSFLCIPVYTHFIVNKLVDALLQACFEESPCVFLCRI